MPWVLSRRSNLARPAGPGPTAVPTAITEDATASPIGDGDRSLVDASPRNMTGPKHRSVIMAEAIDGHSAPCHREGRGHHAAHLEEQPDGALTERGTQASCSMHRDPSWHPAVRGSSMLSRPHHGGGAQPAHSEKMIRLSNSVDNFPRGPSTRADRGTPPRHGVP